MHTRNLGFCLASDAFLTGSTGVPYLWNSDLSHLLAAVPSLYFPRSTSDTLGQWFSTFLLEWNPKERIQYLEEPLCNNSIVVQKSSI